MVEIDGKIIFKVVNTEATVMSELSREEKIKLIKAEMELNDRIAGELFERYGISIRVHL